MVHIVIKVTYLSGVIRERQECLLMRMLVSHCSPPATTLSPHLQLGHSLSEGLTLHSEGRQPQSTLFHNIFLNCITRYYQLESLF
jgi:hypothetical protein